MAPEGATSEVAREVFPSLATNVSAAGALNLLVPTLPLPFCSSLRPFSLSAYFTTPLL